MKRKYFSLLGIIAFFTVSTVQAQYSIPDGLGEAPSGHITFAQNKGQVQYANNTMVPDISYACQRFQLELYAHLNGKISFINRTLDVANDPRSNQNVYRQDLQLVTSTEAFSEISADPIGSEKTQHVSQYYFADTLGDTGAAHYQRVVYENAYPNIDLQVYSNAAGYKIYFVIHPGGDPDDILIKFDGQDSIDVDSTKIALFNNGLQLALGHALA